jgi:hypothetical protein
MPFRQKFPPTITLHNLLDEDMKIAIATIFLWQGEFCYPMKHKRQNKIINEIVEGIPMKYF